PFDPLQALPASARLLHHLQGRYGNLGLAAAAYNAGESRVNKWLRGGGLPRETRNYVRIITGVPVEQWKGAGAGPESFPLAKRMPCPDHVAFASELEAAAETPEPKDAVQRTMRKENTRSVRKTAGKSRLRDKHRRTRTASLALNRG